MSLINEILLLRNKKIYYECLNKIDQEYYNDVLSKSYLRGLITLFLLNNGKELKSKLKSIITDIKATLANSRFKEKVEKLTFESFLKMDKDSEFDEFNFIYGHFNNERKYIAKERIRRNKEIESKRNERLRRNSKYDVNEQGNYIESHLEPHNNSNTSENIIQLPQISFTGDKDLNEEFIK